MNSGADAVDRVGKLKNVLDGAAWRDGAAMEIDCRERAWGFAER